jgi:AbrB family looped-hinge helix DNA binding protein
MRFVLTVSARGGLTLPSKARKLLGIQPNDQILLEAVPDGLLLRPAVTYPVEIYTDKRIAEFDAEEAKLAEVMARKKSA